MARNKREPGAGGGETGEGVGTPAERQESSKAGHETSEHSALPYAAKSVGSISGLGLPLRVLADQIEGTAARRSPT